MRIIEVPELRDGITIGFKDMILVGKNEGANDELNLIVEEKGLDKSKKERAAATDVHSL